MKASQSKEGWDQLMFMMKHADLTSNARMQVGEALVESNRENWNSLTPSEKKLYASNLTGEGVGSAQATIEKLQGKETPLTALDMTLTDVFKAQTNIDGVKQKEATPINAKDNTKAEADSAEANINRPSQKNAISMLGLDATGPQVDQANRSVNSPKQTAPIGMFGIDQTGPQVAQANKAVNSPKQDNPVGIHADDKTGPGVSKAKDSVNSVQDRTVTITTIFQSIKKFIPFAKGTDNHPGGLSVVNDQRGSLYKELITLPSGQSFIPEGRNVMLNLPKGSKVLTASKTKQLLPHYANGIGFNDTKIASLSSRLKVVQEQRTTNGQSDYQLAELIQVLKNLDSKSVTNNYTLNANNTGNSDDFFNQENMKRLIRELAYYTNGERGRLV